MMIWFGVQENYEDLFPRRHESYTYQRLLQVILSPPSIFKYIYTSSNSMCRSCKDHFWNYEKFTFYSTSCVIKFFLFVNLGEIKFFASEIVRFFKICSIINTSSTPTSAQVKEFKKKFEKFTSSTTVIERLKYWNSQILVIYTSFNVSTFEINMLYVFSVEYNHVIWRPSANSLRSAPTWGRRRNQTKSAGIRIFKILIYVKDKC